MPANLAPKLLLYKKGFSLVELMLVIAILSVTIIPLYITYRSSRTNQALLASSEEFMNQARSAHIFARDSKDKKSWGIKYLNTDSYAIYSLSAGSETSKYNYQLEPGVHMTKDFNVLYKIGTGETDSEVVVTFQADNGNAQQVKIYKTGLVERIK